MSSRVLKIGKCTVDGGKQAIVRGRTTTKLQPRDFKMLMLLVESAPEFVSHRTMLDTVWRNKVVGDNVIHQSISRLRKALGDKRGTPAFPTYIETLSKRGYRLIAPMAGQERAGQERSGQERSGQEITEQDRAVQKAAKRRNRAHKAAPHTAKTVSHDVLHAGVGKLSPVVVLPFRDKTDGAIDQTFLDNLNFEVDRALIGRGVGVLNLDHQCYLEDSHMEFGLASQLGAAHMMSASILVRKNMLHILVSVSNVRTQHKVWSERYDRDLSKAFEAIMELADRIASDVCERFGHRLGPRATRRATARSAGSEKVKRRSKPKKGPNNKGRNNKERNNKGQNKGRGSSDTLGVL